VEPVTAAPRAPATMRLTMFMAVATRPGPGDRSHHRVGSRGHHGSQGIGEDDKVDPPASSDVGIPQKVRGEQHRQKPRAAATTRLCQTAWQAIGPARPEHDPRDSGIRRTPACRASSLHELEEEMMLNRVPNNAKEVIDTAAPGGERRRRKKPKSTRG